MAEAAAREAGALLRETRGRAIAARRKADGSLVTAADEAAERVILVRLQAAFPGDGIDSEECGTATEGCGRAWIVDPLDGTTNYSRGLPYFAVSVALWIAGAPAVAAVYLPVLDELFAATAGGPATLNGEPIQVSAVGSPAEAMVNVYFDRHARLEDGLAVFQRVARACEGRVKTMGSTASLLCYVACGRLDGFVRNVTKLYDFAAGRLILERAGGRLTDFEERPVSATGQSLLATNGRVHTALARVCRGGTL